MKDTTNSTQTLLENQKGGILLNSPYEAKNNPVIKTRGKILQEKIIQTNIPHAHRCKNSKTNQKIKFNNTKKDG